MGNGGRGNWRENSISKAWSLFWLRKRLEKLLLIIGRDIADEWKFLDCVCVCVVKSNSDSSVKMQFGRIDGQNRADIFSIQRL